MSSVLVTTPKKSKDTMQIYSKAKRQEREQKMRKHVEKAHLSKDMFDGFVWSTCTAEKKN